MDQVVDIPNNINLKEMFDKQDVIFESEDYQNYLKYLSLFFEKRKYDSVYKDDDIILLNKNRSKNDYTVKPSKFINIFNYEIDSVQEMQEILYRFSQMIENRENLTDEDREEFEILKNRYINLKKHNDEINEIQRSFQEKMQKLYDLKLKKLVDLTLYIQQREEAYSNIYSRITLDKKNRIAKEIKQNGNSMLNGAQIKQLAKDFDLSNDDVENWCKWILASIAYIKEEKEILEIENNILEEKSNYEMECRNLCYSPPVVTKMSKAK